MTQTSNIEQKRKVERMETALQDWKNQANKFSEGTTRRCELERMVQCQKENLFKITGKIY